MENIDLVGIWKVVGCVVLCKNSDLSNCNGASLILRPDGSFSWFGPQTQGILELNNFCAYKVVGTAAKNTPLVNRTNTSHPSISLLFESGCDSTHNQHLCCEVTVKFGNTMVIQFPGLCLMHFRRLSKDFGNSNNSAMDHVESVDSEHNAPSPNKQALGSLGVNTVGDCGDNTCDYRSSNLSSLSNISNADNNTDSFASIACARSLIRDEPIQSDLHCNNGSRDVPSTTTSNPYNSKSCGSVLLPEMQSLALSSHAAPVKSTQQSTSYDSCSPGIHATNPSERKDHGEVFANVSGPLHCFPSQNSSSSVLPSTVISPSNTAAYTSMQFLPSTPFESCSSRSQDTFGGTMVNAKLENKPPNLTLSNDELSETKKDTDRMKRNPSEDPESPSASSVGSSSTTSQTSSRKCQDYPFSLLRALQEGYFSDLILVAENGVKFEVHSTILALSFPNIIWENGIEEDNQRRSVRNFETKADSSSTVAELCIEPASNACKSQESRDLATQLQKSKLKTSTMHNCYQGDDVREATPNILGKDMEDWAEGISYEKVIPSDKDQTSYKNPSKLKEETSKVKLPCLPEAVLHALLHYAYSESLPPSLAPETAHLCLKLLSPPSPVAPHTAAFRNLCSAYLRNTALRQDIVSITSEIHGCLSKMEEHLTMGDYHGMVSSEEDEEEDVDVGGRRMRRERVLVAGTREKTLPHPTPSRLCTALKQATREAAVAIVLALELCQVYAKNRCHLGKMEVHEVAQFAASRLAPLASQLDAVLSALLRSIPPASSPIMAGAPHSPPLHNHQHHNGHEHHRQLPHREGTTLRDRLASHLVPEMESALEVLSNLAMCLKEDLEEVLGTLQENRTAKDEREPTTAVKEDTGIRFPQIDKETKIEMLSYIHQRISFYLFHLLQKKESFSDLGNGGRFRVICQTLEQLAEELPIFLLRLRDALATIDEQLAPEHLSQPLAEWTAKVSGLLSLLSVHRSILQPLLLTISDLVQRETFMISLRRLKLLNSVGEEDETTGHLLLNSSVSASSPTECDSTYKLSLVGSLVRPPNSRQSHLSRRALRLLQTSCNADMVFQVALSSLSSCDADNPPIIDNRLGCLEWDEDSSSVSGGRWVWRVGAHRAIVAARCDWFRRALLSGMKEAIKRQIVVHDTTPQLLQLFLQWIYGGQLQLEANLSQDGRKDGGQYPHGALGAEQLWALLVLADQLEVDDLKSACEHLLLSGGCHLSDPEATLACLSLADQVNARAMRSACLQHISCNPTDVVESELFEELPTSLQSEVYDRLIWNRPRKSQTTEWLLSTPEDDEEDVDDEGKYGIKLSNPLHEQSFFNEGHIVDVDLQQSDHNNLDGMRGEGNSRRDGLEDTAYSESKATPKGV